MQTPRLRVLEVSFAHLRVRTRFPFRYGIASMTEALERWLSYRDDVAAACGVVRPG